MTGTKKYRDVRRRRPRCGFCGRIPAASALALWATPRQRRRTLRPALPQHMPIPLPACTTPPLPAA